MLIEEIPEVETNTVAKIALGVAAFVATYHGARRLLQLRREIKMDKAVDTETLNEAAALVK